MRKQYLVFMLFVAASEHAEKKPLEIKFSKRYCRVVQNYCLGRAPTNFHVAERLLLEWILQNMVRHFVRHKQVQADKRHPL